MPPGVPIHRSVAPTASRYRQPVLALALFSLIALVASLTFARISTNDVWIHLKTGELILRTWSFPRTDQYSFTASGHDYVAHEWLSAVVFYLMHLAFGVAGLVILKVCVMLLSGVFLLLICVVHRDRLSVVLLAFGLMSYVAGSRYLERPHIFSYLFLSVYLFLFFQYRDGGRRRVWLLAILAVHVLWANMHAGFLEGVLLVSVLAGGESVAWMRARYLGIRVEDALPSADLALLVSLPPLLIALSVINPYGVRLLEFPFQLTGMEVFMKEVYEWRSPFDAAYNVTYAFYGYWVWLAVLFGSFVLAGEDEIVWPAWRSARRAANVGLFAVVLAFCYAFMWWEEILVAYRWWWCAAGLLFCVVNFDRLDLSAVCLVAVMFALSMQHNRGVVDAVIATFPVMTRNLTRILDHPPPILRSRVRRDAVRIGGSNPVAVTLLSVVVLAEAASAQVFGYRYRAGSVRLGGIGIGNNMPVCAVHYIVQHDLSGNAFTSYEAAAMLIQQRYPQVKVGMDSRNDVYGADLFVEYQRSRQSLDAMIEYLRKYQVDFFLVGHDDLVLETWHYLLGSGDWAQVFFDDRFVILLRNRPRYASLIAADGYHTLLPSLQEEHPPSFANAEAYLREATRAIQACSEAWLPRWYQAQALVVLERYPEALAANLQIVQRKPDAWFAWAALGQIYSKLQDRARAIDAYKKAIELNPRYLPARVGLSQLDKS